ncbi:S1C family serine protease [Phytohabitans kaempferiae]|uniref:Trypsin-like peptidase domain-containing protein n=1 Tax=Phytohabitans kaempferiae TaxID=1620943 RepID=A0ABV6M7W5_9ACTN
MSDRESNPQGQPAGPDAEPSQPTPEPPAAAREQADSADQTQQMPATPPAAPAAPAGPPATAPVTPPAPPATPAGGAPATPPVPPHAAPPPGPYAPAPSPWQHPDRVHQPTWPGNAGYAGGAVPQPGPAPAGPYAPVSGPHVPTSAAPAGGLPSAHGPVSGSAAPGSVPPASGGAPHYGPYPPGQAPVWAQPPGVHPHQQRPSRFGRYALLGVAALVLMAGSGLVGGAIATAFGESGPTINRTYSAAPVISQADLPGIAAQVSGSVVSIDAGNAGGSGVVMSEDGYVLTNNHVVEGARGGNLSVVFSDGKTARASVVGTDPRTDLAVIKADGVSGLTAAKFGDSDGMQVGDTVLAIGSPLGLEGSVTSGIVSAKDRNIQTGGEQQDPFSQQRGVSSISGLIQTDAPINPGNSGGALVNTRGEVIGINTAILTAGQGSGNIGVGFAIPSNKAKTVADALRNGEKVSHPSLGVSVNDAEGGGALIVSVTENSPAAKAGLQQGDVVKKLGDKDISDSDDLVAAVQAGKVGDQVRITYTRNGQEQTATATLAEAS